MDRQSQKVDATIGRRILEIRLRKRVSQRALAAAAGISPVRLSKLEHAKTPPRFEEVVRIAQALEVNLEEMASGEAPRPRATELVREVEQLASPEELAGLLRLLELLLLGYRSLEIAPAAASPSKPPVKEAGR